MDNKSGIPANLKWGKIIAIATNILAAFCFFLANYFRPNDWFIVAAVTNIIVAVGVYILFSKIEKKFQKTLNRANRNVDNGLNK